MLAKLKRLIARLTDIEMLMSPGDHHRYWRDRARQHGRRAVLNIAHSESEYDAVTARQKDILFPVFERLLTGSERALLDFGCGPGRFTPGLAAMLAAHGGGTAVGVDVVDELLTLAPEATGVTYRHMKDLPPDAAFDVIWVCLVLGGIPDGEIRQVSDGLSAILKPGGLLFLVENTAEDKTAPHWFFRSEAQYRALFPAIALKHETSYLDCGERISVLAGRKQH